MSIEYYIFWLQIEVFIQSWCASYCNAPDTRYQYKTIRSPSKTVLNWLLGFVGSIVAILNNKAFVVEGSEGGNFQF